MPRYVIAGTDTDVGKTVFSAALMLALEAAGQKPYYWKPVQSGIESIDTRRVQDITELPQERFCPEHYIFSESLSPHRAGEIDGVEVDIASLSDLNNIPACDGMLLIEGAGGLMVPLTRKNLQINVYKKWDLPVILCARTELGTINHTLLSLEALWARRIPIKGIAFIGDPNPDNMYTISKLANTKILGRLPLVQDVGALDLLAAFHEGFDIRDFIFDRTPVMKNDNMPADASQQDEAHGG